MAIRKPKGISYESIVSAQGGVATNSQTGAKTYSSSNSGASSARSNDAVVDSTGRIIKEAAPTPMGSFQPQQGQVAGASTVIPVDSIKPVTPIGMPLPSVDTSGATAMAAGVEAGAKATADYLKVEESPKSGAQNQYDLLLSQINSLLPETANKAKDQLKAEKDAGLPQKQKALAALNSQITSRLAEYNKAIAETETAPGETPLGLVMGRQAVLRRNQASDIGLLQARALGMQGEVEMAQEIANRAIDLKYDTLKDTLNVKLQQLQLIQPILDKEERQQAAALQRKYQLEDRQYAEDREKSKSNLELAFTSGTTSKFANRGGEIFRVSDGKPYSNPEEFLRDAGVSSFEEAYTRGYITDITAERIADINFVSQLRADYPDAGIEFGDDDQTAISKLSGSNKYLRENAQEAPGMPQPITINGQSYFQDPNTGTLVPASAFIEGGNTANSGSKYVDNNGQPLKLGAGEIDTISGFDSTTSSAQQALQLLQQGVKTGPAAGIDLKVNKWLGTANPQQMQLEQLLAQITASFTKSLSGAAVSEQEVKRLQAFLPRISDQETVIQSKLSTLIGEMATKKNIFLDAKGGQVNPNFGATSSTQYGPFNSAGNASASVKGVQQKTSFMPQLKTGIEGKKVPLYSAYPQGSTGGQCGVWVRNIVQKQGLNYPAVGNSLAEKAATAKKYGVPLNQARPGSVLLTGENKTNGHVAYIIGKNARGFILAESNYGLNGKVSYGRVIPYNSPSILGVINPTKA